MKKLLLVSIAILLFLCIGGVLVSLLFVPGTPSSRQAFTQPQPPPTVALSLGNRDDIATVFRSLGFDDWQTIQNYRQSTNGQAQIILYDNPVTKASLVLGYGVSDGGHLINKLLSTTDTDPAAMDWITAHLDGGGQTIIGKTDITVTDDTEAGRIIIELALAP